MAEIKFQKKYFQAKIYLSVHENFFISISHRLNQITRDLKEMTYEMK